jgi:general L-amino acid transport system permease protein
MQPSIAPPRSLTSMMKSSLKATFGTPLNAAISVVMLTFFATVLPALYRWGIAAASWSGADRKACVDGGACWVFLRIRWHDLMYGSYPPTEVWRVNLVALMLVALMAGAFLKANPWRRQMVIMLCFAFPVAAGVLLVGGAPGLPYVATRVWGGLMLNVVLAFIAVAGAVPFGLILAEARRAKDRTVRVLATGFIELWRAAPLVTVLFMGIFILPFVMPRGFELNKFVSVAVALVLFNSAYMAEAIRGGLQAVPRGQFQAAEALGLGFWQARWLVIWPQALRMSVPSIVNTAIDLFKDTSLVIIIGLFDMLGAVQQAVRDPQWLGLSAEGYVFVASIFLVICSLLSAMSKSIERELDPGRRN